MPIVIGKSASPRCFKGIKDKKTPLGVPYYSNAKAWVDSVIMSDILSKINQKLARQKRKVILFLDNVSSHSPDLVSKFSNIKIVFLPKNTTSRLQPLDASSARGCTPRCLKQWTIVSALTASQACLTHRMAVRTSIDCDLCGCKGTPINFGKSMFHDQVSIVCFKIFYYASI